MKRIVIIDNHFVVPLGCDAEALVPAVDLRTDSTFSDEELNARGDALSALGVGNIAVDQVGNTIIHNARIVYSVKDPTKACCYCGGSGLVHARFTWWSLLYRSVTMSLKRFFTR